MLPYSLVFSLFRGVFPPRFELRGKRRSGMERNRPANSLGRGFLQPLIVLVDPIAMKPEPPTEMFRHSLILLVGGSAEGRLERE
jgi:hypothetical protein